MFRLSEQSLSILEYPYSYCCCYDGRKECSHQIAVRYMIYLTQNYCKADVRIYFDIPSLVNVQRLLTPIEFFGIQHMLRKKI